MNARQTLQDYDPTSTQIARAGPTRHSFAESSGGRVHARAMGESDYEEADDFDDEGAAVRISLVSAPLVPLSVTNLAAAGRHLPRKMTTGLQPQRCRRSHRLSSL